MILLSDRPTPESIAKIFAEFDPTIFFAIPAVFRNILQVKVCGGRFSPPAAENFSEAVVNAPP